MTDFRGESVQCIRAMRANAELQADTTALTCSLIAAKYSYNLLDSNHTRERTGRVQSLRPLTSPSSYCVVFDMVVEDGAPSRLEIDKAIESKLLITVTPDGYLTHLGLSNYKTN